MRLASTLLLALIPSAVAQTATPAKKPVTAAHRTTATAASTLPPNIPRVPGIAKPLYALKYIDIKLGTGDLAAPSIIGTSQADSKVMFYTVHYTGWLAKDGTKFDSSFDHPGQEPITFPYGAHRVIPGWDTGFEGMHVGGKRRIFIPWQLAYGSAGRAPVIPAKADLIFDMELVSVSDKPPAPPALPAPLKPAPEGTPGQPSTPPAPATPPAAPTAPKVQTDPASNDPAKATTPDNTPKPPTTTSAPPPTR